LHTRSSHLFLLAFLLHRFRRGLRLWSAVPRLGCIRSCRGAAILLLPGRRRAAWLLLPGKLVASLDVQPQRDLCHPGCFGEMWWALLRLQQRDAWVQVSRRKPATLRKQARKHPCMARCHSEADLQCVLEALICQIFVHVCGVAGHVPHHLLEVWLVKVCPGLWVQGLQRCALI
jgi:hypothetical protein